MYVSVHVCTHVYTCIHVCLMYSLIIGGCANRLLHGKHKQHFTQTYIQERMRTDQLGFVNFIEIKFLFASEAVFHSVQISYVMKSFYSFISKLRTGIFPLSEQFWHQFEVFQCDHSFLLQIEDMKIGFDLSQPNVRHPEIL